MMTSAKQEISVLCVDDNAHVVDALRLKFTRDQHFQWKGSLPDAENLLATARRLCPDVIILDIDMPGPDPFKVTAELAEHCPDTRVIYFSGHVRTDYIDRGVEAGAWGYVSKNDGHESLIDVIIRVARGEFALSLEVRAAYDA